MPDTEQIESSTSPKEQSPFEFLQEYPNAPHENQIAAWKAQAPNHRLQIFCPDKKRVFLVRAISGLEDREITSLLPIGMAAEKLEYEYQLAICVKAVVWTNVQGSGVLSDVFLRSTSVGLPKSLYQIIAQLSDFYPPEILFNMTADL